MGLCRKRMTLLWEALPLKSQGPAGRAPRGVLESLGTPPAQWGIPEPPPSQMGCQACLPPHYEGPDAADTPTQSPFCLCAGDPVQEVSLQSGLAVLTVTEPSGSHPHSQQLETHPFLLGHWSSWDSEPEGLTPGRDGSWSRTGSLQGATPSSGYTHKGVVGAAGP